MVTRALLLLLVLRGVPALGAEPRAPAFVIGVYMQPVDNFDAWKARGINTLVGYESRGGAVSNKQWSEAARGRGFYYVRQPGEDLAADARDPRLLSWMHDDEPDVKNPPTDPRLLAEDYTGWKKASADKPVFINFSGGHVLSRRASKDLYVTYMNSADWVGNDFYPVTGFNRPDWLWKVGAAVDRLRDWSGGKPQFCFIETSNQRLAWTPGNTRGVTAEEMRAQVWHAVIHGVRGVVYFPQQIGDKKDVPFEYDATPPKVLEEMVKQNARLAELGEVLASPMNPPQFKVSAASPLEVGWRVRGGNLYVMVLNFSDAAVAGGVVRSPQFQGAEVEVVGEGSRPRRVGEVIEAALGPYEARVYSVILVGG